MRVQDLDTQSVKENSPNKEHVESPSDEKDQPASKSPSVTKEEAPVKSIKKWDSHGKGGGVKMEATSKTVKFTNLQKPDRKPVKQPQSAQKMTTEDSDSYDDEELEQITLDEALMKIEKISVLIQELDEVKKKVGFKNTQLLNLHQEFVLYHFSFTIDDLIFKIR